MARKRQWWQCPICQTKTWAEPHVTPVCPECARQGNHSFPMVRCRGPQDYPAGRRDAATAQQPAIRRVVKRLRRAVLGGKLVLEITDAGVTYRAPRRKAKEGVSAVTLSHEDVVRAALEKEAVAEGLLFRKKDVVDPVLALATHGRKPKANA